MKVAVVGAGVMGLSTALALVQRGHAVTLYDQFPPGHTMGSSHGNSRIVRRDYPDPFYTRIMVEGYPLWSEINKLLGGDIFFESGLLYFGAQSDPDLISLQSGLRENGIDHQTIRKDQSVFPALQLQAGEWGIFNPGAGWAHADRFRAKALSYCLEKGATFVQESVNKLAELRSQFDRVIVTAGAWAKEMFSLPVTVNCQTFAYLEVPNPEAHGPVFIESGPHGIYGFPPESSTSNLIKFGVHSPGPEIDPKDDERPVDPEKAELLRDFAQRRFGIKNPNLVSVQACLYTNTSNTDFIWGEPEPGLFFASPCSGHGFKFGPWIGERLADFAEGKAHPRDWPRFNTVC